MTAEEIQRWDEWFAETNDEESRETWRAAREVCGNNFVALRKWATIIEINRIDRVLALRNEKAPPVVAGGAG